MSQPLLLQTVGVVGAGVMGGGIAQIAAEAGCHVVLTDARAGAADAAKAEIASRLGKRVADGRMSADALTALLARITAGPLAAMASTDIVIEAIVEDLAAKQALFRSLETLVRPDCVLATNTSALSVTALAASCADPARVAGLHFFNPVPAMKLVEIVRGLSTGPEVVAALRELAARLGKVAVVVEDTPGFLVNHAGRAYVTEALHILTEGVADVATIDAVMRDCAGFRLGPFELMDLTGMDVNHPVSETVHAGFYGDPRLKTVPLHRAMRQGGLLGRKAGRGFYTYGPDGSKHAPALPVLPSAPPAERLVVPDPADPVRGLLPDVETITSDDGRSPILRSFVGEDGAAVAARHGDDPARFVGVDMLCASPKRVCLMRLPGSDPAVAGAVAARVTDRAVSILADSPGFVAQRIVLLLMNLAGDIAQQGIATPADIDTAVQLGLAYPKGPLAWADAWGLDRVVAATEALRAAQGTDRYRVSPWLRRRALLGLSASTV